MSAPIHRSGTPDREQVVESVREHGPIEDEDALDDVIRDAGYRPYPTSDAVDPDLHRALLTDWLNEQAGLAFPVNLAPTETTVSVEFELPFGGRFMRKFIRRDAPQQVSGPPFADLLDAADLDLDQLDDLPETSVPVTHTGDGWELDLHADATAQRTDLATHAQSRKQYVRWLAASRVGTVVTALIFGSLCGVAAVAEPGHAGPGWEDAAVVLTVAGFALQWLLTALVWEQLPGVEGILGIHAERISWVDADWEESDQ